MDKDKQHEPNPDDENDARQEAIRDDEQQAAYEAQQKEDETERTKQQAWDDKRLNNPHNHRWVTDARDGVPKMWICGNCEQKNQDGARECYACRVPGINSVLGIIRELEKLRPDIIERCAHDDATISLQAEGEKVMLEQVLTLLNKDA